MADRAPHIPKMEQIRAAEALARKNNELANTMEVVLARIQTSEGGMPTLEAARKFGVSEVELAAYALRFLGKNIREGYGLNVTLSIAEQSGVVTPVEANELYERIKAEMAAAGPVVETEAVIAARAEAAAKWLEEMLASCGE